MTIPIARIRSIPDRYRSRMREVVRAYTLVNERSDDWDDEFLASRVASKAVAQPLRVPREFADVPRRRDLVEAHRR